MPEVDDRLAISISEAARRLGLSRAGAYQQAARGSLPTVKIGSRLLVPVKRLESMLNGDSAAASK